MQPNRNDSTSLSLIEKLQENHSSAWDNLYTLYEPLVRYWCARNHISQQDLPDVVQEVFRTVAQKVESFRKDRKGDTFRGWLKSISRSRSVDWLRRQANRPQATGGSQANQWFLQMAVMDRQPSELEDDDPVENQLTEQLYRDALQIVRKHFHEQTWQAFSRVVIDGLTPSEVAQEMDMKPGAVRVAKSRVLNRLRQELGDVLD